MSRLSLTLLIVYCMMTSVANAQPKTDTWLQQLFLSNASAELKNVLHNPDTFQYQIIYTQIDRDTKNRPQFKHYYLNVDRNRYHNPASTVKLPTVLAALEKLNRLNVPGVDKYTPMLTDSAHSGQTPVTEDTSAACGLPSVAHYAKKILLVSDNDAYNRLYEFVGQQPLNESLWQKGYKDVRITRRFVPMTPEENRHTNPIRFVRDGQVVHQQPAAYSNAQFDFSKGVFIGRAHYNRDEQLVQAPMDFTMHNNLPLEDLQQMLQSVLFPSSVPAHQRFDLSEDDYRFLYRYLSMLPSQSEDPVYDTTEFFDSYAKFLYKDQKSQIPPHIRIYNKTGWSYGFLTDAAYVMDVQNKVEFMISAIIYVNADGVLNDNKYEYTEVGYPFFREIGNILYQHELTRKRKHTPDFTALLP